jgi:NADPH:quinone reductase-like Zn-dependent oxidoreductase
VDVILDMVGGDYFPRNLDVLAMEGRLVQIALLRGANSEIPLWRVMQRRLTITGSTLRPRSIAEKGVIAASVQRAVWPLVEQGRIRPVIHQTYALDQAAEAHRVMETSEHIGKLVLVV